MERTNIMDNAFSFKDVRADMSDIPSYASLDEATLYVMEANTVLFNNLKREIGLTELGIFESTGCTISYVVEAGKGEEGESKSGLMDKAKAAGGYVVNKGKDLKEKLLKIIGIVAGKIKGLFEVALRKINELTAKVAEAFGKRLDEKKLQEALGKTEITFKSGDYSKLLSFVGDAKDPLRVAAFSVEPTRQGYSGNTTVVYNTYDTKVKEALGLGEKEAISKENLKKYFEGEQGTKTLDPNGLEEICKLIKNFQGNNNAVKLLYKNAEKELNDNKKTVQSAKVIDNESVNRINNNLTRMALIYGTAMTCYYNLIRQDVGILIKLKAKATKLGQAADKAAQAAGNAAHAVGHEIDNARAIAHNARDLARQQKDQKTVNKESALFDSDGATTYTEEVESLFNWSF
jgi:hypothetical protein